MKKSTIINISGMAFYLEEEAYKKLEAYFNKLNMHFKDVEDKDEIIEDIENRVAEKFSNTIKNSQSVITLEVVENIIKSMGMPEEFGDEDVEVKSEDSDKNVFANRKLFRDPDNKMVGGVISGFVAYFGIPERYTQLIRLGIVIMLLFDFLNVSWFITLALYIFAYLSIPEAESVTDRVEMRGRPITLANIQSTIAADLEGSEKKISKRKKILLFPFRVIGKVLAFIKWFIKYCLSKIVGIFVIAVSAGLFIGITWLAIMVTFFKDSPLVETPLRTFPDRGIEYVGVFFIYLFFLLPILFALALGISVLRRRYVLKNVITYSFLGVWIVSLFLGGSLLFGSMPEIKQNYEDSGIRNVQSYVLDQFEKVELKGDYDRSLNVKIYRSDENKIVVKGNQSYIKHEVKDNKLTVETLYSSRICLFCIDYAEVEIFTDDFDSIDLQEYASVSLEDFKGDELSINSSDSTYSSIHLKGQANKLNINFTGFTVLQAYDFEANDLDINIGGGTAEVYVKDNLKAKLRKNSRVIYRGNPKVDQENINEYGINNTDSEVISETQYKLDQTKREE
jgi:phage shock protein PspC (stress-responsive transcriptional regulator)